MKKLVMFAILSTMLSGIVNAEHWPSGFYKAVSDPDNVFYYDDEYRWYCHIQNATQATLYDVDSQVRIVGDIYTFLGQAVSLNECPWPNGFFKVANGDGPVYRLYPGNICIISSQEMLDAYGGTDQVIEAEETSNFAAHRTELGQCYWPS